MGIPILAPGAFRLLLAGLVVVSHISRFEIGRLSVMLFFVLSGYWISALWARENGPRPLLHFFKNRILRIWPLYMASVWMAVILLSRYDTLGLTTLTLLGVASTSGPKPLGVEWSLDIEVQFYLLLPLLILGRISLLIVPFAFLVGWWLLDWFGISTVLFYLPAFAAGMLMYRYRDRPLPISANQSVVAFVALTLLFAALPDTRNMLFTGQPRFMDRDIFAMLWMLPLLPYIAASLRIPSTSLDRQLGNFSYPLYLVHVPVMKFCTELGLSKPILVVASLAVAIAFTLLLDIPSQHIRYRLLNRQRLNIKDAR